MIPYAEVVFDEVMGSVEGAGVPTVVVTIDGTVFVGHENVAEDLCACGIGGDNLRLSVEKTIWLMLIEVDRGGDVGGDGGGRVTGFANRVDLDGERHRNTHLTQLICEFDCFGGAPAVSVDDDGRLLFFEGREDAIVVGIEEAQDVLEGLLPMVIAENVGVD